MKIHILYSFKDGPWGGANQFLKAVRDYFIKNESYTEKIEEADIILFNSSPSALSLSLLEAYNSKKNNPKVIFINRIAGPVFYVRDRNLFIDKAFYKFNDTICDGTIFQSNWSKEKNSSLGMKKNYFETTILNAPDLDIFNKQYEKKFDRHQKVKLIATSWSNNIKKGFEVYKWMDENLDFTKYEMTLIGNSPFKFKNIFLKEPMDSKSLASELKKHHIFIFASRIEACSNALLEALHCGLPVVAYNGSSNIEIAGNRGELFNFPQEIPQKLDLIVNNYKKYQNNINLPTIDEVGGLYFGFLKKIYDEKEGSYKPKNPTFFDYLKIKSYVVLWKIEEKLYSIKRLFAK